MNIQSEILAVSSLEESLRAKGAIKGTTAISHDELMGKKGSRGVALLDSLTSLELEYLKYFRYKQSIKETYQESKDWEDVISSDSFHQDENISLQAFIDNIEETHQTKVKDAKHLLKLTGLTYDSFKKELSIKPGEEIKPDEILLQANYSRYFTAIQIAIQNGAKYKDLLQIKPQDYGLPKTWSGCLGSDQYSSILWALSFEFMIGEPDSLMLLPDLRSIAQEVEAPYSVIMDAYNLTNIGK